jgi:nucleoside phosphorylase
MINLVVALKAEARPLIRHYELQHRHADTSYPVYLGTDMALVVSGPGKAAAAAATAWLQGLTQGNKANAWLNIGIAGHASYAVGDGRIANCVTEQATNRSWYPPQVHDLDIATGRLLTVDSPENDYPVDALYDMEAAGFYPVACRFSTSELVQCFKVVSDNRQHANTKITAKHCEQLVASQLKTINSLVAALGNMQKQYNSWHAPHPDLGRLVEQWHFTVSQHHQLARLLKRWTVLVPEQAAWNRELEKKKTAAEVLHCLEQQLNTCS